MRDWTAIQDAWNAGGVVLLPTETVYGLAARADDPSAVSKIYAIKGRAFEKPLAICVRDIAQAETLAMFDSQAKQLAKTYWPGSLTLVLDARTDIKLDPRVTNDNNGIRTIALRCPKADWREAIDAPLALTSANRSGEPDCVNYKDAIAELGGEITASLPATTALSGAPSTILRIADGTLTILRQGELEIEL